MKKPTRNPQQTEVEDMLPEYDFRGGVRGEHARALEQGYTVKVHRLDDTTMVRHFDRQKRTVMPKPDLETSPLPESHRAELERRLADLDENPDTGSSWEKVCARLERHSVSPVASDQPRRGVRK